MEDSLHKYKKSKVFYKVFLKGSDGIGSTKSFKSFQLNTISERFKGLCFIKVEQIYVKDLAILNENPDLNGIYFHSNILQPFSQSSTKKYNQNSVLGFIPAWHSTIDNVLINQESDNAGIIGYLTDNLNISLLDQDGSPIPEQVDAVDTYNDFHIIIRIYPLYKDD